MYRIVRCVLILSFGIMAVCFAILASKLGAIGWVGFTACFVTLFAKEGKRLTAFGSGRWGSAEDMVGSKGLILGRLGKRPSFGSKVRTLLDKRVDDRTACSRMFSHGKELVRLDAVHTLVCAPTGVGKGVSLVIPWLLTNDSSAVVVDFKGELAGITASARRRMGHRDVMLDPWKVVTQRPDTLNPLDFIDKISPRAVDDCNSLANALVIRTGQEKEPHWNDKAEAWLSTVIGLAVIYGNKDTRNLLKVANILSRPDEIKGAMKLTQEKSAIWGGALARMGGQLAHSAGEELASTLSTVGRFISFLNTPAVAESVKASSFNPGDLRKGKMTVFLILPAEYMHSHATLMRMWLVSLMGAVVRGGLQ